MTSLVSCRPLGFVAAACLFSFSAIGATTNAWINSLSAPWSVAGNWSAAQAPSTAFDYTVITNGATKTVLLDGSTPAQNRSVKSLLLSAPAGATNELLVQDVGTDLPFTTSGSLTVGKNGALHVRNSNLRIQATFDISGSLVLESGLIDSTPNFVDVRVGRVAGETGRVLLNGGVLDCFGFGLGKVRYSPGTCTVNGGVLAAGSVLSIGDAFDAASSLYISDGAVLATNDLTKVGNLSFGELHQTGGRSEFSFLSIGDNASGMMSVGGGTVTVTPNQDTDVARVGNFGTGQLDIKGGSVRFKGEFHLADNPGVTGTVIMSGGELMATNALVAIGRYGVADMTVSNATAWLTNTSVGRHTDAIGTLTVQTGGRVFCVDDLSIGRFKNALGYVNVTGGLLSLHNDAIWVGREGTGTLTVSDGTIDARQIFVGMVEKDTNAPPQGTVSITGGVVTVSSNFLVGTPLVSMGLVSVAGGLLDVHNNAGIGLLNVLSGTFELSQGTVRADSLVLTNSAGDFLHRSGTLRVRDLTAANGKPFVVGDGTSPATLELLGGTATFVNGLVLSPNATLTGCGTIIGSIVNSGTINTNCASAVRINSISRSGSTVNVSFTTVSGSMHVLEFKDSLSEPAWSALLPGIVGDGSLATAQDTSATNALRFYRVRVQ